LGNYFDDFHDSVYDMEKTCRWLKQAFENDDDEFILGNTASHICPMSSAYVGLLQWMAS
jgi:hypothetical protein